MLNAWFHGSLKFHSGVRASAGLSGGLLLIALLLMKPRYPKQRNFTNGMFASFWIFVKDIPYVITVVGYVTYDLRSFFSYHMFHRAALALAGLYYPIFFIQLNAIKNGINPSLAFYTVCPCLCLSIALRTTIFSDRNIERCQCHRSRHTKHVGLKDWAIQRHSSKSIHCFYSSLLHIGNK